MNHHALKPICSSDASRPWMLAPFEIAVGEHRLTAATDGHVLVGLDGAYGGGTLAEDKVKPVGALLAQLASAAIETRAEKLRTWAGRESPRRRCERCEGSKEIEHDCECSLCEYTGPEPCPDCDGRGTISPEARPGTICGLAINRNYVARVLRAASANGTVWIAAVETPGTQNRTMGRPGRMLALRGDGWRAAVMEMTERPEGEEFKP